MMRATWSIAWAVGPALGALMISLFDFQGVFLTAAMCVVTATVIVAVARVDALRSTTETGLELKPSIGTIRQAGFAASSLTLFHMAMFMGSIALPIVATHELGGTKADVGLIFSLCAFLEVPVMFAFVLRPSVAGNRRWISVGFLAFILYFLTITWGPSVAIFVGSTSAARRRYRADCVSGHQLHASAHAKSSWFSGHLVLQHSQRRFSVC